MKWAVFQWFIALTSSTTVLAVLPIVASPDMCSNTTIVRYVLESECSDFNTSVLSDPLDWCRIDLDHYGCVHEELISNYGIDCNVTELAETMRSEEVGQGLLAYLDFSYCEDNLPDTQCEREVFMKHNVLGQCLEGFFGLLPFHGYLDSLNNFPSADGVGKLKCSVFLEVLKCYATSGELNDACPVADIARALKTTMDILVEFVQTQPDMITLGEGETQFDVNFTECGDELPTETCPSTAAVADSIVAHCAVAVIYVIRTFGLEPCVMHVNFKECIYEIQLQSECPNDHVMSSVREHSAYLTNIMDGFDFIQCENIFCWHDFVEDTRHNQCSYSYAKVTAASDDNETCRHLRTFVDCVRFMALIVNTHCLHLDIDWLVSIEMSLAGISTCEYPDPARVEPFPTTVPQICNSSIAHRHLIEYYCLQGVDISALTDPDDRCRFEISLHGCMLEVFQLNGVPCTMEQVEEVAHRPETRTGLLDFVGSDCHDIGHSTDTECMEHFYATVGRLTAQHCHDYLHAFSRLPSLLTLDEVNAINSSDGQTSLKCSAFEETLMCFMRSDNTTGCTADDYTPALEKVLHISYQFMLHELPIGGTVPEITYEDCPATINNQFPTGGCPTSSSMADLIVATCASEVLWQLSTTGEHPCSATGTFISCVQNVPIPSSDMCSEEHLWNATDEYSWYITENIGGSADLCRGCTAYGSTYQEYVGHTILGFQCMMNSVTNTTLQECLDLCTGLERCLSASFYHTLSYCILHQCSFVTHPQEWGEWNVEIGTTTYVKDCDHSQAIVQCPMGQEYNLSSASCVDCPIGTYKEDVYGHCILCPFGVKTDGVGATSLYNCSVPYFYCTSVSDCQDPVMSCANNTCVCPPEQYYDFTTDRCVALDCKNISGRYLKLSDTSVHVDENCSISDNFGISLDACLYQCDLHPDCRAIFYYTSHSGSICRLMRCYDVSTNFDIDIYAFLFDAFINSCSPGALECYTNGTIRFPNPNPEVYVDAMAIQDEGSDNATKCDVEAGDVDIIITGCSMDSDITVFFSNRTLGDSDVFSGMKSQAYTVRCNKIRRSPICYPNGTIQFPNPDPSVYVDAMAVQNQGSQNASKCLVDPQGLYILITGCRTDLEVTIFFSNRSLGDNDVFGGRRSQAYTVMCNDLPDSGVTREVENYFGPRLEVTPQAAVTPSFTVTSALRSGSFTGVTVSTAVVGEPVYWTIDIPSEYRGRPTCRAYSGSSSGGNPSLLIVLDGCTQDTSLVADQFSEAVPPIGQSQRIWTILYAFKFYNADDVFLECTVKVCKASSNSCDYSCPSSPIEKRSVEDEVGYHRDELEYFTTGSRLHIVSTGNTKHCLSIGLWLVAAILASVCNYL